MSTLRPEQKRELEAKMQDFVGCEIGPPDVGRDAVNEAMVRQWCDAIGDENPIYTDAEQAAKSVHGGLVAPPTMLQAWILPGMEMADQDAPPKDKQQELHKLLSDYGYSSVVATNCDQGYTRYLKPGDTVTGVTVIETISEEKATALGIGYFINTRTTFRDAAGEEVGWMTFRVLKFISSQPPAAATEDAAVAAMPTRMRPPRSFDNGWWWDGIDRGEILIQKCNACGALHHPTRPMCGKCQSTDLGFIASSGIGTINTFTVMHHPPFPGYEYPLVAAVVDLEEGTRLVANVVGCDASEVHIGMKVQAEIEKVDDELSMPVFRPVT